MIYAFGSQKEARILRILLRSKKHGAFLSIVCQSYVMEGLGSENERLRQDIDALRSHLQEALCED